MSRKSKRNQQGAVSPQPQSQPSPTTNGTHRRTVFIVTVIALLVAFAAATLFYRSERTRAAQIAAAKNRPALTSGHSPAFGRPDAKVHIVEFLDPACETCATFFPHVEQLLSANPDRIRLSIRHVPFHKGSDQVVRILEAARAQGKYLPTLQAFYATQGRWVVHHEVQADRVWQSLAGLGLDLDKLRADMNAPELARRMAQDMADARTLGVTMTPEFFVNGRPLPSFGLDQLQTLVDEELRRAYP